MVLVHCYPVYVQFLSIRLEQEKKNEQYAETDRMFGRTRVILVGTCILILELCKAGNPANNILLSVKQDQNAVFGLKKTCRD